MNPMKLDDIAEELDVSSGTLHGWRSKTKDFPKPRKTLPGRIAGQHYYFYDLEEVRAWVTRRRASKNYFRTPEPDPMHGLDLKLARQFILAGLRLTTDEAAV